MYCLYRTDEYVRIRNTFECGNLKKKKNEAINHINIYDQRGYGTYRTGTIVI